MIPLLVLLGGAGAALFLSGCGGSSKTPEHPEPAAPPEDPTPAGPKPDFNEPDNWLAFYTHKKLIEKGISSKLMDKGTFRPNFGGSVCANAKETFCTSGAGDGKLSATEILDFAFSDTLNYDTTLWEVLGHPLPYDLDDYDSNTSYDADIRGKVKQGIEFLDALLAKQNITKDSPEYQEKMAVGLYFLTAMPNAQIIQREKKFFEDVTQELETLKLSDFKYYLIEKGGLRITKRNEGSELSAIEALRQGKGNAPEHAKVLHAVLRMAHLKPDFVYVNPWKSQDPTLKAELHANPTLEHVCVGIKIGDKMRLLDARYASSQPAHPEYVTLSLRHFLAMDYLNRGIAAMAAGNFEAQQRFWDISQKLDAESPFLQNAMGMMSMLQGKPDDAMKQFNRATEIYPNYTLAHFSRGNLRASKEEWAEAEADFSKAILAGPEFAAAYQIRGSIRADQGKMADAMQDFDRLIALSPAEGYFNRGNAHAKMNDLNKAFEDFNKAIQSNPQMGEAYGSRGLVWAQRGDLKKATADFKQYLNFAPSDRAMTVTLTALAPLIAQKWAQPENMKTWEKLAKEGGVDAVKADTWMKVAGMIWEVGQHEAALKAIQSFAGDFQAIKKKLIEEKKGVPPSVQSFLTELMQSLPPTMRKDPKVQEVFKSMT